jgi:bacillithiol biosynthesis cysteine-adding enzyme BshC
MKLEYYPIRRSQLLAEDYIRNFAAVKDFYEYDPSEEAGWRRRAEWLDADRLPRAGREQLADRLSAYNRRIGNTPESLAAINALRDGRTLTVVGGQQAGLFTGPLLVIYKALTVIQTARKAENLLGRRVVPVFWIAGEDHDFDEVNHIYWLNSDPSVQKLKIDHPTGLRSPVSAVPISESVWLEALGRLDEALPDSEFKPELLDMLKSTCLSSATLSDAFARILVRLFGRYGLVLLDSADREIRALEGPMFRRMIAEGTTLSEAYLSARHRVEAAGYEAQAEVSPDCANLFVIHQDERVLLYKEGSLFCDRRKSVSFTEAELLDLAEREPEKLSNNVLTRPLMQDYLLPVLSTVLGPGEIAYWALTRDAFRTIGGQMPIITARREFTLLEPPVRKAMQKFGLDFEDVIARFEAKKQEWLISRDSYKIDERFSEVKDRVHELYKPLIQWLGELEPGLASLGETNERKILEQIEYLHTRADSAFRRRHDAALKQLDRVQLSIWPLMKMQERVFNIAFYLNRYGDRWLHDLAALPPERFGEHAVVNL